MGTGEKKSGIENRILSRWEVLTLGELMVSVNLISELSFNPVLSTKNKQTASCT